MGLRHHHASVALELKPFPPRRYSGKVNKPKFLQAQY